jgi:hypothetical protein
MSRESKEKKMLGMAPMMHKACRACRNLYLRALLSDVRWTGCEGELRKKLQEIKWQTKGFKGA